MEHVRGENEMSQKCNVCGNDMEKKEPWKRGEEEEEEVKGITWTSDEIWGVGGKGPAIVRRLDKGKK